MLAEVGEQRVERRLVHGRERRVAFRRQLDREHLAERLDGGADPLLPPLPAPSLWRWGRTHSR